MAKLSDWFLGLFEPGREQKMYIISNRVGISEYVSLCIKNTHSLILTRKLNPLFDLHQAVQAPGSNNPKHRLESFAIYVQQYLHLNHLNLSNSSRDIVSELS